MSLRSLLGLKPKAPPGSTYFVDHIMGGDGYETYVVRLVPPGGIAGPWCKQVGPTFTKDDEASAYRESLEGGPAYRYPEGGA